MLMTPTAGHHESFLNTLVRRWQTWKEQRENLAALESCGRGELARMAHDLSLSTGELRSLAAKGPDAADLLYRRMDDLGLDGDSISHRDAKALWDMQRACSLCDSKGRCRRDFSRDAEPSAWHPYCPNDDTLAALAAGGAHAGRPGRSGGSAALAAAIADDNRRGWYWSLFGLLLVSFAWLALLAAPPSGPHSSLRRLAPIAPKTATAPAVDCLDASCLSAPQQAALRDLRAVQAQGWIGSSAEEIASLPRATRLAQGVHAGEAIACQRAGGTTYYGFMFQRGCSKGGIEAARLEGFNECRPMAGGGVCLLN
jgi:hypothetical protein